ncbi:MAG: hypothetical protein ACLUEK_13255 [Oscillospiraceae bacterium]
MSPADLSDEVRSTLDGLRGMGLKLAIGSRAEHALHPGWAWAVRRRERRQQYHPLEARPEVFLKAAEMWPGASVCLVVEDAVSGARCRATPGFDVACVGDAAARAGEYNMDSKRAARYSRQIRSGMGKGPSSKTENAQGAQNRRHRERQERFSRCLLAVRASPARLHGSR